MKCVSTLYTIDKNAVIVTGADIVPINKIGEKRIEVPEGSILIYRDGKIITHIEGDIEIVKSSICDNYILKVWK